MKKYLLIALAVMVFATPVMAQPTLSGTFRLGAFWDVQDQNYASRLDRARLVLRSNIDEFNAVRFEMRLIDQDKVVMELLREGVQVEWVALVIMVKVMKY